MVDVCRGDVRHGGGKYSRAWRPSCVVCISRWNGSRGCQKSMCKPRQNRNVKDLIGWKILSLHKTALARYIFRQMRMSLDLGLGSPWGRGGGSQRLETRGRELEIEVLLNPRKQR